MENVGPFLIFNESNAVKWCNFIANDQGVFVYETPLLFDRSEPQWRLEVQDNQARSILYYAWDPAKSEALAFVIEASILYCIPQGKEGRIPNAVFQAQFLAGKMSWRLASKRAKEFLNFNSTLLPTRNAALEFTPLSIPKFNIQNEKPVPVIFPTIEAYEAYDLLKPEHCYFIIDKTHLPNVLPERSMYVWFAEGHYHYRINFFGDHREGVFDNNLDAAILKKFRIFKFFGCFAEVTVSLDTLFMELSRAYLGLTFAQQNQIVAEVHASWPLSETMSPEEQIRTLLYLIHQHQGINELPETKEEQNFEELKEEQEVNEVLQAIAEDFNLNSFVKRFISMEGEQQEAFYTNPYDTLARDKETVCIKPFILALLASAVRACGYNSPIMLPRTCSDSLSCEPFQKEKWSDRHYNLCSFMVNATNGLETVDLAGLTSLELDHLHIDLLSQADFSQSLSLEVANQALGLVKAMHGCGEYEAKSLLDKARENLIKILEVRLHLKFWNESNRRDSEEVARSILALIPDGEQLIRLLAQLSSVCKSDLITVLDDELAFYVENINFLVGLLETLNEEQQEFLLMALQNKLKEITFTCVDLGKVLNATLSSSAKEIVCNALGEENIIALLGNSGRLAETIAELPLEMGRQLMMIFDDKIKNIIDDKKAVSKSLGRILNGIDYDEQRAFRRRLARRWDFCNKIFVSPNMDTRYIQYVTDHKMCFLNLYFRLCSFIEENDMAVQPAQPRSWGFFAHLQPVWAAKWLLSILTVHQKFEIAQYQYFEGNLPIFLRNNSEKELFKVFLEIYAPQYDFASDEMSQEIHL